MNNTPYGDWNLEASIERVTIEEMQKETYNKIRMNKNEGV